MRPPARAALALVAVAASSACGLFGKAAPHYAPVNPAGVALSSKATTVVHIGLVVSPGSPEGEGRDVASLAQGARVAEVRFNQRGKKVVLDVADDHGTAVGARAAVTTLQGQGVVGIVYASEGPHVAAGLAAAAAAHLAVLLPYSGSVPTSSGAWLTGPSAHQVLTVLSKRLNDEHLGAPFPVSLSQPAPQLDVSGGPGATRSSLTSAAALRAVPPAARAVLAWGTAAESAAIVERLQALKVTVPVVLSPAALSSTFATTLATDGASTGAATAAGRYLTAGLPTSFDSTAAVGFSAAVRLAASDPRVVSVISGSSFQDEGADTADGRAHDAVIALVAAASRSAEPDTATVLSALPSLRLSQGDGLVGGSLSFDTADALSSGSVQPLQSAVAADGKHLVWFALPAAAGTP